MLGLDQKADGPCLPWYFLNQAVAFQGLDHLVVKEIQRRAIERQHREWALALEARLRP